jgi:hypothetical protein
MSISIPNRVTTIGTGAFYGAGYSGLSSIVCVIPDSVKTIGTGAFSYAQFTEYEIGTGITSIGNHAFTSNIGYENSRITKMTIRATTPPTLQNHSIYGDIYSGSSYYPIYVPSGSLNRYKSADYYLPRTRLLSI